MYTDHTDLWADSLDQWRFTGSTVHWGGSVCCDLLRLFLLLRKSAMRFLICHLPYVHPFTSAYPGLGVDAVCRKTWSYCKWHSLVSAGSGLLPSETEIRQQGIVKCTTKLQSWPWRICEVRTLMAEYYSCSYNCLMCFMYYKIYNNTYTLQLYSLIINMYVLCLFL